MRRSMPYTTTSERERVRDRPNVLLVVLDTARADATEPYGASPGTTPVLKDLASRGTAVRSAYAPSSWTLPSHASLFTGLMPRALGLGQAPDGLPTSCPPLVAAQEHRWLPSVLQRAGWSTRAVSSNVWVSAASGFDLGFGSFAQVSGHRRTSMGAPGTKARLQWLAHAMKADADAGARQARAEVDGWLAEDGTAPFFWFVNLLECHSPYLPPKPWNDLGLLGRARAADESRRHLTLQAVWQASLTGQPVPATALDRLRHLYQRAVSSMDAWLGGVLEELDRRRLLDDTVVIVTSDHGENFGDDGLMGHAFSVDERLVRIPLVVSGPGSWDADAVTSLVDVPRALTAALGLEGTAYADDPGPSGIAVSTLDPLAAEDHPSARAVTERWQLAARGITMLTTPAAAATDGRWKLVQDGAGERAYDLDSDRLGVLAVPVDRVPGPVLTRLRAALTSSVPQAPPTTGTATPNDDVDTEELEAQLRLLGYL
jgi:arylsulfatase A-like enzyme